MNARFHFRGPTPPDNRLVLVAIDAGSILGESLDEEDVKSNPGYELLKTFPYHRKAWALAFEKILSAGARVIVMDVVLSSESVLTDPETGRADNAELTRVLAKYHRQIVIGANYTTAEFGLAQTAQPLTMPHADLLPSDEVPDEEIVGFVNYQYDPDGFIRRMHPVGWPADPFVSLPYSIDALAVKKAFPEVKLPQQGEERLIIYAGPNGTYDPVPFHLLFNTKAWEPQRPPLYGGRLFKDKIVLIGPRANVFHDEHRAPFGTGNQNLMYGPDIHMHAISTILSGRILEGMGLHWSLVLIVGVGIVYACVLPLPKSPAGKLVPAFFTLVIYLALAQACFVYMDFFIALVPVVALIVGSTCTVVTGQAIGEQLEKRRVSGMLRSYVSQNIADELIKSGQDVNAVLAPQRRSVTILFSDIRSFTTMTENSEPGPLVEQLNEYLTAMVECVFNNQGTLDKFVGDAVMAVYGNPTTQGKDQDAWGAVKTALEMRERLAELNKSWEERGKPFFRIGIGINHGEVMAGDLGSKQRREFGVIGDAVNVAARVEGLNKDFKTDILITETVHDLVKDLVEVELKGDIKVKGRMQPVKVYTLLSLKTVCALPVQPAKKAEATTQPAHAATSA